MEAINNLPSSVSSAGKDISRKAAKPLRTAKNSQRAAIPLRFLAALRLCEILSILAARRRITPEGTAGMRRLWVGLVLAVCLHASLITFTSNAEITIPPIGAATPYPSEIDVVGIENALA